MKILRFKATKTVWVPGPAGHLNWDQVENCDALNKVLDLMTPIQESPVMDALGYESFELSDEEFEGLVGQ